MAGRPRTFDRTAALDVALDAFWRHGYQQTSVAELTHDMGIRPPSLYAAFGDKQHLFQEAADRYIARFRAGLEASLDAPTARAGVDALLRAAARAHTAPGRPPGCLVLCEPRLADERVRMRGVIAERIARGIRDGDVPAGADPRALAAYADVVMAGMSARARDGAERDELIATAAIAMTAFPDPA